MLRAHRIEIRLVMKPEFVKDYLYIKKSSMRELWEQFNSLDEETQEHIAGKYYGGIRPIGTGVLEAWRKIECLMWMI